MREAWRIKITQGTREKMVEMETTCGSGKDCGYWLSLIAYRDDDPSARM
jgi:hypothetical protein